MKIPELKRSKIGVIAEFHGIPNKFPNQAEEECEASDKDDWQIEMPDGDEIDDIEEACVEEDSPPPKNRQRLSC